ncbi:TPA: hypothetical protein ACGW3M_001183 [Pseudomonas aeruginosa]|nr:hypothetical protein [Pseudomonas aeruginosa]EKY4114605.1 hypothetical protein [Pseudomonas aeruginosa]ELJ2278131.1 hypothetical protein [Pseudomonas aeruginosa]MBX6653602.1 hypothetical protein [Pseudomonas aeruginosa]
MSTRFVSSQDELFELISDNHREAIFVGGDLVYVTIDKERLNSGDLDVGEYVVQPPRLAARGKIYDSSSRANMYLGIRKECIQYLIDYKGSVYFLADQYLAYGLSLRSNTIVVGGGEIGNGAYNLEIFIFTGQRLVATQERNCSLSLNELELIFSQIRLDYPEHIIHWCSPLPDPPLCSFTNDSELFVEVESTPLNNPVKKKIHPKQVKQEESYGLLPAIGMVSFSAVVFCAAVGIPWSGISSERQEYKNEIKGFEQVYSNSSHSLDLLRHRKSFLDQQPSHFQRMQVTDHLLTQISRLGGVVIKKVAVFDEADQEATLNSLGTSTASRVDFKVEIMVPVESDQSARDQAEPILAQLNHSTGMNFMLTDHAGVHEKRGEKSYPFWIYRLSGTINSPEAEVGHGN